MVIKMEDVDDNTIAKGEATEHALPEKEPETIGEALKKYYEEQLTHTANADSGRKATLMQILAVHSMALN